MNNDFPVGLLLGFLVSSIAFGVVFCNSRDKFEREAVQHGAATWTVDEDGNRVFKWRESK